MVFSMEPDKFFPYSQIDIVQFPNGLGGDDIIENTFKGPIHQQLRDALQFIKNTIITPKVTKYPDRAEADRLFNYPYAALEADGSPKPEFETDDDHSYFISRLFIHETFLEDALKKEPKRSRKRAERNYVMLNLLRENPTMTQTMIMDRLQLSRKQVQKVIKELQEQGLLNREGSNRNGKWVVKG